MPSTRNTKQAEMELAANIREEVSRVIQNDDIISKLVNAIKLTLVDELTKKVSEALTASFEFELHARDERIKKLETQLLDIHDKLDESDQYSRRNCLLFHGVEENKNENTVNVISAICENKFNIKLHENDVDRSHRLSSSKGNKPRGIIVKFTNYNIRDRIYRARKSLRHLDGTPLFVHESLTKQRSDLFWKVKSGYASLVKSVWTQDGRIIALLKEGNRKLTLSRLKDLEKLDQLMSP